MTDDQQADDQQADDQRAADADPTAEFLAAATRFAESVRPWLTAAIIEHAAHPEGAPGTCRLCAIGGAVGEHWEDLATELTGELGGFAERLREDLQRLIEEVLGTVATALTAALADYEATVRPAPSTSGGEAEDSAGPAPEPPRVERGGFQRIEIRMEDS